MFEVAELGQKVAKAEYRQRLPALRTQLLQAQYQLRTADFPVIVLISGVDGAGKGDTLNLLHEWLDPRYIHTEAFAQPSEEERERPHFWRFWRALPARGQMAMYIGSWYSGPLAQRVAGKLSSAELDEELGRINSFERELVADGALIIKLWLHLSQQQQARRLRKLEKDPATRWRVTKLDHKHLKHYDEFRHAAEHTLRITSTGEAPWHIIEGADARYRGLTVGQIILDRIHQHVEQRQAQAEAEANNSDSAATPQLTAARVVSLLDSLDLEKSLAAKEYKQQLEHEQGRLNHLARQASKRGLSTIVVLEGWDAAGKGGVIRRMAAAMDARFYHIIPIAAPSDEEKAHHYLWRFWRHIGRAGHMTIYDRSWYGRVLVERVEGLASVPQWRRAYAEINDFESQLVEHGMVLNKFWLHINKQEQLRRFKQREATPFKRYKISDEDYRNRAQWEVYEQAVNDMVEQTSTEYAPWVLVEGNDKRYARIKILHQLNERLTMALKGR